MAAADPVSIGFWRKANCSGFFASPTCRCCTLVVALVVDVAVFIATIVVVILQVLLAIRRHGRLGWWLRAGLLAEIQRVHAQIDRPMDDGGTRRRRLHGQRRLQRRRVYCHVRLVATLAFVRGALTMSSLLLLLLLLLPLLVVFVVLVLLLRRSELIELLEALYLNFGRHGSGRRVKPSGTGASSPSPRRCLQEHDGSAVQQGGTVTTGCCREAERQRRNEHVLELLRGEGRAATLTVLLLLLLHRCRRLVMMPVVVLPVSRRRVEQLQLLHRIVAGRVLRRVVDDGALHLVARDASVPVAQVPLAVRLGRERVVAERTLVRTVAIVRAHVPDERRLVADDVRAHVALVGARPGRRHVRPVVALERAQVREDSGADAARELAAQLHAPELDGERVLRLLRFVAGTGRVRVHVHVLATAHATTATSTAAAASQSTAEIEQARERRLGTGGPIQLLPTEQSARRSHVDDRLNVGQIFASVLLQMVVMLLLLPMVVYSGLKAEPVGDSSGSCFTPGWDGVNGEVKDLSSDEGVVGASDSVPPAPPPPPPPLPTDRFCRSRLAKKSSRRSSKGPAVASADENAAAADVC
uniref:Uncharacterized protein n=1 Tax=Anopheles atroparvus TaxID=41427 RepID=A0A182JD14_ANOAO